jgi:putative zinc finger/helix-turn-helix YgiT family protein
VTSDAAVGALSQSGLTVSSLAPMPDSTRVSAAMLEFNNQANAAIIDPELIARVCNKFGLDQREAAEIFGGGVNAFSRYENGRTAPPLAMVRLLKVLDRHPDLLAESERLDCGLSRLQGKSSLIPIAVGMLRPICQAAYSDSSVMPAPKRHRHILRRKEKS